MIWERAAAARLESAEKELRFAQLGLGNGCSESKKRYTNALLEVQKAERFVARVSRTVGQPLCAGEGLFG